MLPLPHRAGSLFAPLAFLVAVGMSMTVSARSAYACDSTGCLLATTGRNGVLPRKGWTLDFSYRYTDQTDARQGTRPTSEVLRPLVDFEGRRIVPAYHQEIGGEEQFFQMDLAHGLTSRLTVSVSVPLMARRYFRVSHFGYDLAYATTGLGDTLFGARFAATADKSLVFGVAAKIPTGDSRNVSEPDDKILDPTLQPGTGSLDFLATAQYAHRLAALSTDVVATASYQVDRRNGLGYRFGDEALAAVTFVRAWGRWTPSLQVKLFQKGHSRYLGDPVGSTGGTTGYLTPGLRFTVAPASFYGYLLKPSYRRVNDAQLTARWGFVAGFSASF